MNSFYLLFLVILTAAVHLYAEYAGKRKWVYFFKPLTIFLIILIAVIQEVEISFAYKVLILAALFFSLWGDVFLMLSDRHFTKGLIAFLIAHLFYIYAFIEAAGFQLNIYFLIPVTLYALLFLKKLLPSAGEKKIAVVLYTGVILLMFWQAGARWYEMPSHSAFLAMVGATLFVISDSILAINRFVGKIAAGQFAILTLYYLAQLCFAFSV